MPATTKVTTRSPLGAAIAARFELEDKVLEMFSEMIANGYVDGDSGIIESRCKPSLLRGILSHLRERGLRA